MKNEGKFEKFKEKVVDFADEYSTAIVTAMSIISTGLVVCVSVYGIKNMYDQTQILNERNDVLKDIRNSGVDAVLDQLKKIN